METSDNKKNRLKLRGVSKVGNACHENVNKKSHDLVQENPLTSATKNSDISRDRLSDKDKIIITIEDEKEDCCDDHDKNEISKFKYDTDLLELRRILKSIPFPPCDVWQLQDLPIYTMGSTKRNVSEQKTETDNDLLCRLLLENPPLHRLKREYLCRKKTVDNIIASEENYDSDSVSTFTSARASSSKRKCSDTLETESKRLKLNESSENISSRSSPQESKKVHPGLEEVKCSMCPICSKTFEIRMKQIDIDSHIAGCLSEAGDDLTW